MNVFLTTSLYLLSALAATVSAKPFVAYQNSASFPSWRSPYEGSNGVCVPECDSHIFCEGEILHAVQMARIFPDSKTFVDLKLKSAPQDIEMEFEKMKNQSGSLSPQQIKDFVNRYFVEDPLVSWSPPDIKAMPSIVADIVDDNYKKWALSLNQIWKDLAARITEDARDNPDRHSIIYLPNGFIKAGGRFAEMYYWDTYWVIRGLLLCDMYDTVRGIIENMIWLVSIYGHVPNGSRVYYTQRSQPPLLMQMAATYHSTTKDHKFIKDNLKYFDLEFQFWYNNRMVDVHKDGKVYRMARYNATSCSPRPESYYEDYVLSQNLTTDEQKKKLFTAIKSAAESGWDFSTRHIRGVDGSNKGTLLDMDPPAMVYVDLNCILQANAVVLSEWYRFFGNEVRSQYYRNIANKLLIAIEEVLWNEQVGMWLDWDLILGQSRNYFYPSNLTPLWTGSYRKKIGYAEKAIVYLLTQGIIKYDFTPVYYGVPTSKENSGQQWDYPNAWAPLQAIVIQGMERTQHPIAKYVAYKMASNWIKTTYAGFAENGFMYEKYSAVEPGTTGEGGEYTPQTGFGWTNGVVLEFLHTWGKFLRVHLT